MSDRPDGQMQRNRDSDNYGFHSLCSQPGAVAALSYALFGSEIRGQRCPGAVGGDSIVGHGNANPDVRGLREALCALFERNDEHLTENHRRPLSRCETRKLQMRRKVCKVCARLVRTFCCLQSVAMVAIVLILLSSSSVSAKRQTLKPLFEALILMFTINKPVWLKDAVWWRGLTHEHLPLI